MEFIHVGLVSQSEVNADRFFGELLGLPKTKKSQLPREITEALFGVDQDCELLYYGESDLVFEVFVMGFCEPRDRRISHTCIAVTDRPGLLARCREMGFEVREVPKGQKVVVFIVDADGNLFEVNQR
jgi:catechol 2,3-dioxygenase-like lactoylglutathione lyase family enzyme